MKRKLRLTRSDLSGLLMQLSVIEFNELVNVGRWGEQLAHVLDGRMMKLVNLEREIRKRSIDFILTKDNTELNKVFKGYGWMITIS